MLLYTFLILLYVPSCCYFMCPHTAIHVSSHSYICVLMLLCTCPHTAIYVSSSYCYIHVLTLLCMCPHTPIYVSSYFYTRVLPGASLVPTPLYSYFVMLYSYCTRTLPALYPHCTHTVLIIYSYCTRTLRVPYSYVSHTLLIFYTDTSPQE